MIINKPSNERSPGSSTHFILRDQLTGIYVGGGPFVDSEGKDYNFTLINR